MNLVRRVFTERRSAVLPVMVFLLANVGVLALGVFPLQRSVANLKAGELEALTARGQAAKAEAAAKAAALGKDRAESELRKFYGEVLPVSAQSASQLTYAWLDRLAKESGVAYDRGTFKEDEVRESRLMRWTGKVKLVGELLGYSQVPLRRGNRRRVRHHRRSGIGPARSHARRRHARARIESRDVFPPAIAGRGVLEVKLLPPPGPQRRRQLILLTLLLGTLAVVLWRFVLPEMGGNEPAVAAVRTSNPQTRPPAGNTAPPSTLPEALRLGSLEPVPDAPEVGRNPFAFGVPPRPPVPVAPPVVAQPPPPPAPPPWPPPIALKLVTIIEGPTGRQASLKDPASGSTFLALEGAIVDGRYRVLKVAQQSVVVSYVDGSGQRTLTLGS